MNEKLRLFKRLDGNISDTLFTMCQFDLIDLETREKIEHILNIKFEEFEKAESFVSSIGNI